MLVILRYPSWYMSSASEELPESLQKGTRPDVENLAVLFYELGDDVSEVLPVLVPVEFG